MEFAVSDLSYSTAFAGYQSGRRLDSYAIMSQYLAF